MNKSDLIEELSEGEEITKTKAEEVVNLFFGEMTNALAAGERVEIRGLGSFKVKNYGGYTGRNPKTGKQIKVKPKKLSFFKCAKELKERVDTLKKGSQRRKFMKQLKKDLQGVSKTLKQLTLRTENIVKRLDKLEKPKPVKKAKAKVKAKPKVTKKPVKVSAAATVLAIIKRSKKGVDVATLKNKAGIGSATVNSIIYRLKKKGKIKSGGRGIYVKA